VNKIANNDDLFGLIVRYEGFQSIEVGYGYIHGDGNAMLPEMCRFAQVQVGQDQRFLVFPVYRSLCVKG
jgi:hypothetical protein